MQPFSRPRRLHALLFAALAGGAWVSAAHAELRALLVGISGYPTLDEKLRLEGPKNDVQRMRQVLQQRGFAERNITVLADGVAGAQEPNRANILHALAAQAREAHRGDIVVLYFAGHGSQQPANRNTPEGRLEADGLHEIFLPYDVGRWDGSKGSVHNALVDYELRVAVDRIVDRGAFVWGIFDACHSASLVRSADDKGIRYRHVRPEDLGVSTAALDAAAADAVRTRGGAPEATPLGETAARPGHGQAVFFYAAQTSEQTPELRLPFASEQREPYGLFSFMIARALEVPQPMTYRQLGQSILAQYGSINEAKVTPLFAGTALDQTVLGQQRIDVRQWPLRAERWSIPSGALTGISEGALFAVVANPTAKTDDALGYLKAKRVQLHESTLEPVAHAGKPAPGSAAAGSYARLLSNPEPYALRVALDTRQCGSPCVWDPVLAQLRKDGVAGASIQWTSSGAEVLLQLLPDRVLALSPSEQGEVDCGKAGKCKEPRRGTTLSAWKGGVDDSAASGQISNALHAIARARNLMALAARLTAQSRETGLTVRLEAEAASTGKRLGLTPEKVSTLHAGDVVRVRLENRGQKALDVTLLYADARYGISALYPTGAGEINRIEPGGTLDIDDIGISDSDGVVGIERLIAISVEAEKHGERADFSFLAQPPLKNADLRTRAGFVSDEMQAFLDAGYADFVQRGEPARLPGSRTGMQVYTFDVRPGGR